MQKKKPRNKMREANKKEKGLRKGGDNENNLQQLSTEQRATGASH